MSLQENIAASVVFKLSDLCVWSESEGDMGEKRNQILQQTGNPFFEKIEKSEFTTEEICVLPLWELLARFVRHWGLPFTFLIPS